MLLQMTLVALAIAVSGVMYAAARWLVTGRASPVARCLADHRIDKIVRRETRELDRQYTDLTKRH